MRTSPLQSHYESIDAATVPYGSQATVIAQCDAVELEYAAIRKSVALMDGSHRGLLKLTGRDRLDFLHRMVTNDCRSLQPGQVGRAMILNAKGRIMADLLVIHAAEQTLIDTDIHQAATVAQELEKLLFSEDVQITDLTDTHHRVSLHGPASAHVLDWWRGNGSDPSMDYRYDETGEAGIHIWTQAQTLSRFADASPTLYEKFKLRFIGWMAWNIARIEAGRAMFHIDFGPDNLPHEAGPDVLREAVSFTKGCYRGQEIVARMHSRGHPARQLVGFRVEGDALPVAGVGITAEDSPEAPVVGAVTSSTLSPMLGAVPVGFAMMKWSFHEVGQRLYIPAEGGRVPATVHPLPFHPPSDAK